MELYNDPELKQSFMATYEEQRVGMERQYKELNSGKWWEQTEAEISETHPVSGDVALCCVMLHYDVALCCVMLRYVPLLQGAILHCP